MDTKIVVYLHHGVLLSYQKQWLNQIIKKMAASREYHPEWDNPVTKEQLLCAVADSGMLTPEACTAQEKTHRLCEVQEK